MAARFIEFTYAKSVLDNFGTPTAAVVARPTANTAGDFLTTTIICAGNATFTPPTGWTLLREVSTGTSSSNRKLLVYTRVATGTEPASWSWTPSNGLAAVAVTLWRGQSSATPVDVHGGTALASSPSIQTPSLTAVAPGRLVFFGGANHAGITDVTPPSGMTQRMDSAASSETEVLFTADQSVVAGVTGTRSATTGTATETVGIALVLRDENLPPNAPTLVAPVGNATIDRTATQRFSWSISDPDAGDTQSKYDLQYRLVGAGSWTAVTGTTPNQFHDFTANTLTAGSYEWQVRTYDAAGLVGPYSGSGFFTAASPPTAPTITAPINNQVIGSQSVTLTWSYPTQQAYQAQLLDASDVVLTDTGIVENSVTRSVVFALNDNNVTRKLRVRVRDGGLWSAYSTVTFTVSYTPPAAPTVGALGDNSTGTITVAVTNPAPAGGQPAVVSNDLYVRCAATNPTADQHRPHSETGLRIGTALPSNVTFIDGEDGQGQPASGVIYEYRAVAVAANGTSATSAWTA